MKTIESFLGLETGKIERKLLKITCMHEINFTDAKNLREKEDESVDLVITSPPYGSIKNYGNDKQIGFNDDIPSYLDRLMKIIDECIRVLKIDRKMCINIGDQFISGKESSDSVYRIIPIHAMIVNRITELHPDEIAYAGSIYWSKVTTSNTSGGGKIMGSYPYPRNGYFFTNREFIIVMRKIGKKKKDDKPSASSKQASVMTRKEWRTYFRDTWNDIRPERQDSHIAMFPVEIPYRLIKMYSFVNDTVLDPFLGSGTTSLAASLLGRNSIGYEIGFESVNDVRFQDIIKNKIERPRTAFTITDRKKKKKDLLLDVKINNHYFYPFPPESHVLHGVDE